MDLEENEGPTGPCTQVHHGCATMFYNVEHFTLKFGYTS